MTAQTKPGHLAANGELNLKHTAKTLESMTRKQQGLVRLAKLKPVALDWKIKTKGE